MSLTLSVLTFRNQPPQRSISKRFSGIGGTIGRLEQNDLVLPDPERIVSRTHARIDFRDGSYFLTSLGQNPIDLNGRPLGAGGTAELSSGDRLTIGAYCIVAEIQADGSLASDPAGAGALIAHQGAGLDFPLSTEAEGRMAFGIDLGGTAPAAFPSVESRPPDQLPLSSRGMQRDELPGFLEPLPRAVSARPAQIPDDYDLLRGLEGKSEPPGGSPAPPAVLPSDASRSKPVDPFAETAAVRGPQFPSPPALDVVPDGSGPRPTFEDRAETPRGETQRRSEVGVASARAEDAYVQAVRTLLQAAGVPELEDRALGNPDFLRSVGELLRESVAGLLKALVARALTKRELRVDMTMLATTENNPLKFCPDAFEALTHLLAPRPRSGYLPPIRAVREAYEDLQAHNLAVMAGMRAALQGVLLRFDPAQLEKHLASHPLL
ncbi:MAG TPA: type VI secretion system-associated FHA domain protein TagH, partial [Burkholderiales bacterium]|nr:type VI secretion system-associated FHA domain protein TagH [Burkholderiales bacterium]